MKIKLKLTRTNEINKIEIKDGSTVEDVLKMKNLKPDTVIVMYKNKPIPIDDKIKDSQELNIVQVSSSG